MVDDMPRMYWIHWYTTGDGPTLARGVAAALARMNSARKANPNTDRMVWRESQACACRPVTGVTEHAGPRSGARRGSAPSQYNPFAMMQ